MENKYHEHLHRFCAKTLLLFFLLNLPLPTDAQRRWDGGAGTTNWMDAANWIGDEVPKPNESVQLLAATVDIPSGNTVLVQNIDLCCSSSITIASGATLSCNYASMQGSGTFITNNGILIINGGWTFGISVGGFTTFTNNGNTVINNVGAEGGIKLFSSTATNNGDILIDGSSSNGDGIHIINYLENVSTFTNHGDVVIRNTTGDGVSGSGIYHNYGSTEITNVIYFQDLLLDGEDNLQFKHYAGAMFKGEGQIDPTTFYWEGGELSSESNGGEPEIIEFFCAGNCSGENFSGANLLLDIAGTAGPGMSDGHDQIQVSHVAELGGSTIDVNLESGYTPKLGDEFTLMTYASKTGADPTFNLPSLPSGIYWNVMVGATGIQAALSSQLPVELTRFDASAQNGQVELIWETAREKNNRGFEVQRSADGKIWQPIGFLNGHGDSQHSNIYHFTDHTPLPGLSYYRLRQMDFDGTESFSEMRSAHIMDESPFKVFPNPVAPNGELTIQLIDISPPFFTATLLNHDGRILQSHLGESTHLSFALDDLPPGIYFLKLKTNAFMSMEKILVY